MRAHGFHFQPRVVAKCLAAGAGIFATGYGTFAGISWLRFGRTKKIARDKLLDRFMPDFDVVEHHGIRVAAPAEVTLDAAGSVDPEKSPLIRCIFKARELAMGARPQTEERGKSIIDRVTSLGWKVLAQDPSREIVFGAVTQPWLANVVFRPLDPEEFVSFAEPEYVKIAWTLRVHPIGPDQSYFCTETRAKATDAIARRKFRRYWSLVSAGVVMIRWLMLRLTKVEAERRPRLEQQAALPGVVVLTHDAEPRCAKSLSMTTETA